MQGDITPLTWDLTRFYPVGDFTGPVNDVVAAVTAAEEFRSLYLGRLAELPVDALREALAAYEQLQEAALRPQLYAQLLFYSDSANDEYKKLSQKTAEVGNQLQRQVLFFDLEIMAMPDERFALLVAAEQLAVYRHYLTSTRKFQQYALPEREEQLLKMKNLTGSEAFSRLFDEVSSSFHYSLTIDGEEQEMTGEELLGLLHHPDRNLREEAFSLFLNRHGEHNLVFSSIFNTIVLDHGEEITLRGYQHPMEPTNIGNELSDAVVERMMTVSEENYPLAQDYFRLKARLLGLPKLKNTDLYAPLDETSRSYSFSEAKEMVLAAYGEFNPAYRAIIEGFFTEGRIDALPRPGKAGGAFCMGMTPSLPPYLLLNYTGNLRDVSTLAHELGHGLHFVLAQRQTLLSYHAPLPLAETASVFGEMLLTRYLLRQETDRSVKISLLCAKIEDIIATTFRQNVLTRFEQRLHQERHDGLLTTTRLGDLWLEENAKLFGDAVEMIEPYRWGWSYISHFIHARFYCYSYTFAELLVLALYQIYLKEGSAFLPRYEAILSSGGALSPADTVRPAGIDLADPHFWQEGYNLLHELLDELKELVN